MKRLFLLLFAWSAVMLMLMSPDSPIHGAWNRTDSAIFFTSGKALMNGLRPYVDFTDSKGPLLWLIYGTGYLLSPRSYVGVYVISIFFYAGIFWYTFKTARLLTGNDDRRAAAVTLLMTFAYFMQWFDYEIRAESFSTLFVLVSVYYMCRLLYGGNAAAQPTVRRCGLVLGACFMALVMIKYNIAAMQGIIVLAVLWYYGRERKEYVRPVAWMALGAAAVAVPFLVYLELRGAVPAFIEEYFFNTLRTVAMDEQDENRPGDLIEDFMVSWSRPENLALMMGTVYGGWQTARRLTRYRFVPLLVGVFFCLVAMRRDLGYYFCVCKPFLIYLAVCLVDLSTKAPGKRTLALIAASAVAWGVFVNLQEGCQLNDVAIWTHNDKRTTYETISSAMDGSHKPRILTLFSSDDGFGLYQEALPAGRYWTHQFGSTPEMTKEHTGPMETGKADYVIVVDEMLGTSHGWPPGRILSCGYTRVLREELKRYDGSSTNVAVYKKQ